MQVNSATVFESLRLEEYRYSLPDERIAIHPLPERDKSKLLVYSGGQISHRHFFNLPEVLPANSLLVFNNTRVIPARLQFRKETGALIEIFLLQPVAPSPDLQLAMGATGSSSWECMIGNRKRWKVEQVLNREVLVAGQPLLLEAWQDNEKPSVVHLRWSPSAISFAEVVEAVGEIPLPPYLKRKAEQTDSERYQTIYSSQKGAVAAPTAGLHFTRDVLQQLQQREIKTEQLTLHVGAGTFQPIKEQNLALHPMHREQLIITEANVLHLLEHQGPIVAVGTTSMRTLESLYWYGVQLLQDPQAPFFVAKDAPYQPSPQALPSRATALAAVLAKVRQTADKQLRGETEIFIVPGYRFQICRGLVTNFHQPESTLMLLVAAFVGPDWKKIYQEALEKQYRFLSYGDSSCLLPATNSPL